MSLDEQYAFRATLVGALSHDLLGPDAPDELIEDDPITKYLTGILYPLSEVSSGEAELARLAPEVDGEADDESGGTGEEGAGDPAVALSSVRYPSSMGMTFAVDSTTSDEVTFEIAAGRYHQIDADDVADRGARSRRHRAGAVERRWRREQIAWGPRTFSLEPMEHRQPVVDGLELYLRVRPADADGHVTITAALVNRNVVQQGQLRDAAAFLQPQLIATAAGPAIVERRSSRAATADDDLRSYALLYRHARTFAVGHGCSVTWTADESGLATEVRTTFIPEHDLLLSDSNPSIPTHDLSMLRLSRGSKDAVLAALRGLATGYESWIDDLAGQVAQLPMALQAIAGEHVDGCRAALGRMQVGIRLLETGPVDVLAAFRTANEAMLVQRAQAAWVKAGRPASGPQLDESHCWRPFQVAFILLCLEGVVDPDSSDRQLADLLWFPTGGGKTEAYLGLIAFSVALRRSRGRGAGVTVLMRYTLRLLTIQQFERAALLICALEVLRRTDPSTHPLGDDEVSIALWVGQGATPNSLQDARRALDKLSAGKELNEGNPVQIHACPWCGTPLDHRNYWIGDVRRRLFVGCRQSDCPFEKGLPVYLIDDDIYSQRPTLVIATADKFASLPWRAEAASLFNLTPPTAPPPDLIIQDELHLISGPLGTLAGLYETAIDIACERSGHRPKVVASTATIRRARDQSRALFDREVAQFPPPGLDARDSYFAVEARRDAKGSRLYVGLMAPGASQTTLLVRTYAALMQAAGTITGSDAARDPYWTLVGYFNSLRVLGGAKLQLQDDVRDRIELLASGSGHPARSNEPFIELTSREPSADIPSHLSRMAVQYPSDDALAAILATNMISVGVDIDRLGLMAVMGQPQTTSEYIQATSRVGRQHPGLVVTMLNAARSRDRSHYESFSGYHSALYRQVESTSVTPFSPRSRDRGLHAVLVALARLLVPGARDDRNAADVASFEQGVRSLCAQVVERVGRISPEEATSVERELADIVDIWIARAAQARGNSSLLTYRNQDHPDRALLVDASRDDIDLPGLLHTMWSLRDVDRSSNLYEVR